ncbi:hypothetical protein HDU87_001268 [Geranomyces variabilis]|uniref:Bromo domain-containing protein n=1 Tax=Geranomyces variabilis TaxID=109894 RepID=A0AAD5TDL7_9FUNG|nr:hypothetical protein HDU87_001268 [Geranomyces variabilis]
MSSIQHMFGNVDEKGKLDTDLPEELRQTLDDQSDDYLGNLLGDPGFEAKPGDVAADAADAVKPNADAIDFSTIGNDDLVDLPEPALPATAPYVFIPPPPPLSQPLPPASFSSAIAEEQQRQQKVYDTATLARIFPGFDEGVMKFSTMFSPQIVHRGGAAAAAAAVGKPLRKRLNKAAFARMQPYPVAHDERELFKQRLPPVVGEPRRPAAALLVLPEAWQVDGDDDVARVMISGRAESGAVDREALDKEFDPAWGGHVPPSLYPVMLDRWEDKVLWDEEQQPPPPPVQPTPIYKAFLLRNYDLESGPWEDAIQWEGEPIAPPPPPQPHPVATPPLQQPTSALVTLPPSSAARRHSRRGGAVDVYKSRMRRFNLSQDRHYEGKAHLGTDRVRQTYGPGILQHAYPAVRIHPQYFKHNLSTKELRSFHRPTLRPPLNTPMKFSRVRQLKKRKIKGADAAIVMRTTRDITLKDSTRYVLMEYSEEYPPIVMNTGMGSLMYNYYRKIGEKDATVPELEVGAPFILEEVDASPFMGFGDVEPGQTIQAFTNNMFRAPVFRQKAADTDFLVIRHTYKGESKYYIRDIPFMFAVGQTFPLIEVPRPQSRRITHTVKGRLQVATFRYMRRDPNRLLLYKAIVKQFPHFTEPQLRQRLKEFAQFAVKGENTGYWKLKQGIRLLDEEEMQRLVTPEMICLQECMQTGQQRLVDIGYSDVGLDTEDNNDEDEATGDIELQLAPWTTTKNFVLASQNKSMIKLYGAGDPSGRGEAFSFIRASMKEPFLRYGESAEERAERDRHRPKSSHRFSFAEQQQVYREEIKRIWDAQIASLSAVEAPRDGGGAGGGGGSGSGGGNAAGGVGASGGGHHGEEDMEALSSRRGQMELDEETRRRNEYGSHHPPRAASPPSFHPPARYSDGGDDDDDDDDDENRDEATSVAESGTSYGQSSKTKRLTIRRLFRDPRTGHEEERSEVITDMKIVNAYLRQRAIIENQEAMMEAERDAEAERKRKRRRVREHVDKMKEDRKGKKGRTDGGNSGGSGGAGEEKKNPGVFMLKIRNTSAQNLGATPVKRGSTSGVTNAQPHQQPHQQQQDATAAAAGDVADEYAPHHGKSYGRRRAAPEVDLASHLARVVGELIDIPEAYEFCRPVSQVHVPDYYVVVKRPRNLEQIRDDVRNYSYSSAAEFMRDVQLVADNCRLYNGPLHPLTAIADGLVARATARLLELGQDLREPAPAPAPVGGIAIPPPPPLPLPPPPVGGAATPMDLDVAPQMQQIHDPLPSAPVG